ncbi:amino acid transporter [Xylariaceae sp. FL1651]|nr:amino acid transporter [Xylariaceae sp. FL1651]
MSYRTDSEPQLQQKLTGYQIFFIVISAVIGTGVFTDNGQVLALAGSLGMLVGVIILGLIAFAVGETVSEFVQVFPAPNGIFEYVHAFVDEEFAWVVAICYWYSFASVAATQVKQAGDLLAFYGPHESLVAIFIYGFTPIILFGLNLSGVWYFGVVETVGGFLKTVLLVSVSITLYVISGNSDITLSFEHSPLTSNNFEAFAIATPAIAYGFIGIESTVMAAYEAKPPNAIRWSSRTIHGATLLMYIFATVAIALTVNWDNPALPAPFSGIIRDPPGSSAPMSSSGAGQSSSVVVIAIMERSQTGAAIVNGALVFSVLSAANTSLYIASRTLYGLTYRIRGRSAISKLLKKLSTVWEVTGAPAAALFWSVALFYPLPFLELVHDEPHKQRIQDAIDIISITSSVSCLVVWAAICIAFIRFERWTRLCSDGLHDRGYSRFIRDSPEYKREVRTVLIWGQPYVAWLGLAGCLVVFAFSSATFWNSRDNLVLKVFAAYGTQFLLLVFWGVLKLFGKWDNWVTMEVESNPRKLIRRLQNLEFLSRTAEQRELYYGAYPQSDDALRPVRQQAMNSREYPLNDMDNRPVNAQRAYSTDDTDISDHQ